MTYSQHAFDGEPPIAYRLDEPAKLIAALPAVLGFVPEKSLVLVNIDHGEMGAVMRVDLGDDMVGTIAHLARVAAASGTDAVVAVIVDADQAGCEACADEFRLIAEQLAEHLTRHGVSLIGSHVVDRVAAGGRWHCADLCGAGGEVADPFASPLAAAAVLEGRPLYGCRSDLVAVIAVDPARRRRVAAAITRRL